MNEQIQWQKIKSCNESTDQKWCEKKNCICDLERNILNYEWIFCRMCDTMTRIIEMYFDAFLISLCVGSWKHIAGIDDIAESNEFV